MRPAIAPRVGQSSVIALVALPLLLGLLLLVLLLFRTRDCMIELRNAGVAASLAGCEDLADDDLLGHQPDRIRSVLDRAARSAAEVAHRNTIAGRRPELTPDDVTFGTLDRAVGGQFVPLHPNASTTDLSLVNAIEVTVRQPGKSEVFTRVTALLDRSVIGFRPWSEKSAPVVPVALHADTDAEDHFGWNDSCHRTDHDEWAFDRDQKRFVPGKDGLPEIRVRVGRQPTGRSEEVCGFPLVIGSSTPAESVDQIRSGLSTEILTSPGLNGEFKLSEGASQPIGGIPDLFEGRMRDSAEQAFRALMLVGEPRAWPLFSGFDDDGRAVLIGFTAARVVAVERISEGGLILTLQPALLATPTAITDPARPSGGRNVVKVRLAG